MNKRPTVFISYNQDSGSVIADEAEKKLASIAEVVRDKSTMSAWDNIVDFMKTIRKQDMVVLIVTDKYLKSIGCMFEVSEAMKDDDWEKKFIPIVADDASGIYDVVQHVSYQKYWENKEKEIENAIREIGDPVRSSALLEEQKKVRAIRDCFSEFLNSVKNRLNPSMDKALDAVFDHIKGTYSANNEQDKQNSFSYEHSILHPVNERFLEVFNVFMNSDLKEKTRANNVRQYAEGIVDTLLRAKIEAHIKENEKYENYSWKRKLGVLQEHYDKDITDKLRRISEVGGAGSHFWDDVKLDELNEIIEIANHLVEDIIIKYFTSESHLFGTENNNWCFSMLPLENRIYILERVYKSVKNRSVVDRLSLAYTKNGEKDKAIDLLNEAYLEGILSEDAKNEYEYKYQVLERNLSKVQDLNSDIETTNGYQSVVVDCSMAVTGFPSSKDIFDCSRAYECLKKYFDGSKDEYPEFMNMFMMLMSRDNRKYIDSMAEG